MSVTLNAGITATSPAASASITRCPSSLVASGLAASWTRTYSISGAILSSAIFTLLVRVDPPVTTVTASPSILRNSASNPAGAATII